MAPEATSTGKVSATLDDSKGKTSKQSSRRKSRNTTIATPKTPNMRKEYVSVYDRPTPKRDRKSLKENYEGQVSGREDWWRSTIRETPVPGAYESRDFLMDLETKDASCTFKTEGRKRPVKQKRGAILLPGAYEQHDLAYELDKKHMTYTFNNTERTALPGFKDKDINVCPTEYPMEKYLTLSTHKSPTKHAIFKSNSQRFPTIYFKGTKNPAPCHYEYTSPSTAPTISSSFKSQTPRFKTSHTKVPGPGTYEKTYQSPQPATIIKMGRNHGLFFTSAFNLP
ncbi:protein STPG4-like [Antedon mediterranea]|uniref:protein STPG4-like n=1 Tax=Antedon mediterranea TaxID=105859 RepID=UPI003AF94770